MVSCVSSSASKVLQAEFEQSEQRFLHPTWLLKRLQKAYPQQWQHIVEANNLRPPMWLRVNRNHHSRDAWLALLAESGMEGFPHPGYPDAVRMASAVPVSALPGFDEGWVTVQDASARDVSPSLNRKMVNASWTCVPRQAVKPRIFLKPLRKPVFWLSTLMSNVFPASMTTLNVWE
jgi:16S rRNA C967 or C1407 C5-methylase (RsmB/RsmF family)